MNFSQLHERLRLEIWRRIQRGVVTGKLLAAQTGLRPSHISNFLHRKRKLSLTSLDQMLAAQQITIQELAGFPAESHEPYRGHQLAELHVPLVSQLSAVSLPTIPLRAIQGYIVLPAGELDRFPPRPSAARRSWHRFIAIRASNDQARPMEPVLRELSLLIIDRHYNSLVPVAPPRPNLYALRLGSQILFRYVTFESNRLLLRPHRLEFPIDAIDLAPYDSPFDLLIGRVCLSISEL